MDADLYAVLGAIALSIAVVPAAVLALVTAGDPPPAAALGALALSPGVVMGGVALWVAARG